MRDIDTVRHWVDSVADWTELHDDTINIVTLILVAIGLVYLGVAEVLTWITVRVTRNATELGRDLLVKNLADGVFKICFGLLYGLTIWSLVSQYEFGSYPRLIIRVTAIIAISFASVAATRFILSLLRQRMLDIQASRRDRSI